MDESCGHGSFVWVAGGLPGVAPADGIYFVDDFRGYWFQA